MSPPPPANADVRMRGFAQRVTVDAAWAWLDAVLPALGDLPTETISLRTAAGRVLAGAVVSAVPVPGFARSMMDGYAVRADDTSGATAYNRLPLTILGSAYPGAPYPGDVAPGSCVRIMTGAPLPPGADAVVPVEFTELDGQTMLALEAMSTGKHVGAVAEDVRAGDAVLPTGRVLRPQDLGVLSSIGVAELTVVRRPRVRVLITGNELLPAGTAPRGVQIADANGPMLSALVQRDGGELEFAGLLPDDPGVIRAALFDAADVVLVSGGSSVGQEDHVPRLLAEEGELAVHGVAMRPSSPAGMGRLGNRLVFLLPGNPVSCLCAYDFFAGRAIRALGGRSRDWPYVRRTAVLSRKLVSTVGRVDYARVQLRGDFAEPLAISGAAILSSTTRADGFVIVPANSEGFPEGATVDVLLY